MPPKTNLSTQVVQSGVWIYGRMIATSVINIGVMAILARQLAPAAFGLVALAQVVLRFLVVIGSEGVNEFVIYDNQPGREERIQAAFWMDLTFSLASAGIGLLLVPWLTKFYAEPNLGPILVVMLLRYPFDSLSKVPDALLKKSLDFQRLAIRDTILEVSAAIMQVVLALAGWGVWSLVIPITLASPLRAIIVFQMAHWRPSLQFHFHLWQRIFSYSANVIGSSLATYILNDGDTLLIGKLLGSSTLGVYNLAWMVANIVPRNISGLTSKLAFPTLSAVSGDMVRLRAGLARMLQVLAIITFPPLIGLFVVADNFILTVYGPHWNEAVLPLRILIIFAIRLAVGSPVAAVYKAVGRPDLGFKLSLAIVPFYLLGIWLGSFYGLVGVAVGVTLVRTLLGSVSFELTARCLQVRFLDVLRPMALPLFASLWMGGSVFLCKLILSQFFPATSLVALLFLVACGGLVYFLLLRTVYHDLALELARLSAPVAGPFQGWINKALRIT
jgi:PST family polysaccharide transporter